MCEQHHPTAPPPRDSASPLGSEGPDAVVTLKLGRNCTTFSPHVAICHCGNGLSAAAAASSAANQHSRSGCAERGEGVDRFPLGLLKGAQTVTVHLNATRHHFHSDFVETCVDYSQRDKDSPLNKARTALCFRPIRVSFRRLCNSQKGKKKLSVKVLSHSGS